MNNWEPDLTGETATGPSVAVAADGALVAVASALWDDVSGVRVSINWQDGLDDLSASQARTLAAALHQLADVEPPR